MDRRDLKRGQNPFRERNPMNALKREELMVRSPYASRMDEYKRVLAERQESTRIFEPDGVRTD